MLLASLAATPLGALARPVAGVILRPSVPSSPSSPAPVEGAATLIVTLPGSPKGAKENLEGLLRVLPHALELAGGARSRSTEVHRKLEQGEDGMKGIEGAGDGKDEGEKAVESNVSKGASSGHGCGHHHHHPHGAAGGGGGHVAPRSRTLRSQDPSTAIAARQRQSPWPLVSVRDAMSLIFDNTPVAPVQTRAVDASLLGAVLAEDVVAEVNIPNLPSTNIDGYGTSRCSLHLLSDF